MDGERKGALEDQIEQVLHLKLAHAQANGKEHDRFTNVATNHFANATADLQYDETDAKSYFDSIKGLYQSNNRESTFLAGPVDTDRTPDSSNN